MLHSLYREGSESWRFSPPSTAVLVVGFICALAVHRYVITGAYVILCLYAMLGPKQAIKALSLNYIILFLNPTIQVLPAETSALRWVILFLAGLRVFLAIPSNSSRFLMPLLLFFAMVTALSLLNSPNFAISFLKIIVFTYCSATVLIAFNALKGPDLAELRRWFLTISGAVIFLSLPTLAIPKMGFLLNGKGFQGIFNHPQLLGVFLAPTAAYLGARLLLRSCHESPYVWGFWGLAMVLMVLTQARTALLAFFLSLAAAMAAGLFSSRRDLLQLAPYRALIALMIAATVLTAGIFSSPAISKTIAGFWLKRDQKTVEESFYRSRGAGISFFWNRFLQNPLIGQGFGIIKGHGIDKNQVTFLGIPVSASTEFGFLPAAFMEQVGLLGLACFIPFFLFLLRGAVS